MVDFYVLREEELRPEDDLSPFNLPLFLYFGLHVVFEKKKKTREKADYGE